MAQAAVARLEEARRAAEQKMARHAELAAAALAEKSAQHAKLRSRLGGLEQQRQLAAERRCRHMPIKFTNPYTCSPCTACVNQLFLIGGLQCFVAVFLCSSCKKAEEWRCKAGGTARQ